MPARRRLAIKGHVVDPRNPDRRVGPMAANDEAAIAAILDAALDATDGHQPDVTDLAGSPLDDYVCLSVYELEDILRLHLLGETGDDDPEEDA